MFGVDQSVKADLRQSIHEIGAKKWHRLPIIGRMLTWLIHVGLVFQRWCFPFPGKLKDFILFIQRHWLSTNGRLVAIVQESHVRNLRFKNQLTCRLKRWKSKQILGKSWLHGASNDPSLTTSLVPALTRPHPRQVFANVPVSCVTTGTGRRDDTYVMVWYKAKVMLIECTMSISEMRTRKVLVTYEWFFPSLKTNNDAQHDTWAVY